MSIKVNYKGAEILDYAENGTKTLKTGGKYCEGDISITNTQDGGITPTGQIEITENGTYDVAEKASAVVNVSGGGGYDLTPSANQIKALIRVPNWNKKQCVRIARTSEGDGKGTIDWGDGTTDAISLSTNIEYSPQRSHEYASGGLYVVTITANAGNTLYTSQINSYYTLFEIPLITGEYYNNSTILRKGALTRIVELHFGTNVRCDRINNTPNVYVKDYANNGTTYQGSGCTEIIIPDGTTIVSDYSFSGTVCEYIKIPSTVTSVKGNAFSGCSASVIDFTEFTLVDDNFPVTLAHTNAFSNFVGYIVVATEEIATVLKSATNWSTYATKIKYRDEVTEW